MRPSRSRASPSPTSAPRAGSKPSLVAATPASASSSSSAPMQPSSRRRTTWLTSPSVERKTFDDRQLDAVLERLDRLCSEVHTLNRRLDSGEHLLRIAHELSTLNDSLQALAYAALGQQGPQIRRRRRSA